VTETLPIPLVPALCALARSAGFVAAGSWPLLPGGCLRVRLAATVALTAAALPRAVATTSAQDLASVPLDGLLGLALGACVAAVAAATSWAVSLALAALGEDGQPAESGREDDPLEPLVGSGDALARLAFWMGTAAFFTAGGERWVVGGIVASFDSLPPGAWRLEDLGTLAGELATTGLAIAVSLAIPLLVAIVTFRLTTAIVLRTAGLAPAPGLLRAVSILLVLAGLVVAADLLAGRLGHALEGPLERALGGVASLDRAEARRAEDEPSRNPDGELTRE
jgi:type III secretory pathway component EscT